MWEHIVLAMIAALPASLAAWSSIRNGKVLRNGSANKRASSGLYDAPDWFAVRDAESGTAPPPSATAKKKIG